MISKYKDRVATAEQNLKFFEKSVQECNIPVMLDNSLQFIDTIKNADSLYLSLPSKIKENEKNIKRKSHALLERYFEIRSHIGYLCECKSPILRQ